MTSRRFLARIAFAFALLLSQQLGIAHAISHFSSDTSSGGLDQKQLPGEMQCGQCLAFAAIGSALNGQPPTFCLPFQSPQPAPAAPLAKPLLSLTRAFDSRAPPVVL